MPDSLVPCPEECDRLVFDRVTVESKIEGGTRVSWELSSHFHDPQPHTFQLQVGRTANQNADDWESVGGTVEDEFFAIDDTKRVYGGTQWTHYRVILQTALGTYYSRAERAGSNLDKRDFRIVRTMINGFRIGMRYGASLGYLLKRRVAGEECDCVDYQTHEVRNPEHLRCYGTGIVDGYFSPMDCVYAKFEPVSRHEEVDGGQGRGTINDVVVQAIMLSLPFMNENDVWVDKNSGDRWIVHRISNQTEYKGVPLISAVELRLAKYSDIIYQFPVP